MILTDSWKNFLITPDKRLLVKKRIQKNWMRKTYTEIPILACVDICELNFVVEALCKIYYNCTAS